MYWKIGATPLNTCCNLRCFVPRSVKQEMPSAGKRKAPVERSSSPGVQKGTGKKKSAKPHSENTKEGWFTTRNALLFVGTLVCCGAAAIVPSLWLRPSRFNNPLLQPKVIDSYMTEQDGYQQRLWGSFR